jgi:hypothetical protein
LSSVRELIDLAKSYQGLVVGTSDKNDAGDANDGLRMDLSDDQQSRMFKILREVATQKVVKQE